MRVIHKSAVAFFLVACTLPGAVHIAHAGQKLTGVIELFTSQGCSSCPPADAVLSQMAGRADVLALGYHVDYWNYLGWEDTLSSAENTARQYAYAASLASRTVYTPQAVVNGGMHFNGANKALIENYIAENPFWLDVAMVKQDDMISIKMDGSSDRNVGEANIVLVFFKARVNVQITRGENKGRTITYANAVTGFRTMGMWHGKPVSIDISKTELAKHDADGCAIIVQTISDGQYPGPIIGAALLQ